MICKNTNQRIAGQPTCIHNKNIYSYLKRNMVTAWICVRLKATDTSRCLVHDTVIIKMRDSLTHGVRVEHHVKLLVTWTQKSNAVQWSHKEMRWAGRANNRSYEFSDAGATVRHLMKLFMRDLNPCGSLEQLPNNNSTLRKCPNKLQTRVAAAGHSFILPLYQSRVWLSSWISSSAYHPPTAPFAANSTPSHTLTERANILISTSLASVVVWVAVRGPRSPQPSHIKLDPSCINFTSLLWNRRLTTVQWVWPGFEWLWWLRLDNEVEVYRHMLRRR